MGGIGFADGHHDTKARAGHRKDDEQTVVMQEQRDLICGRGLFSFQLHVGEHPVVRLGLAVEGDAKPMPHGAMGAVAANEPKRPNRLRTAIRAPETGLDMIAPDRQSPPA